MAGSNHHRPIRKNDERRSTDGNRKFSPSTFSRTYTADRNSLGGGGGSVRIPDIARQRARIAPQFAVLQQAFEAQRLKLQQTARWRTRNSFLQHTAGLRNGG